jgi:hypothetical protein
VDVNVLVNGSAVFGDLIVRNGVSTSFADDLTLPAGSTVDFVVGPNGNFVPHAGNTGLEATIIANPVPEPSTLIFLSLGTVALLGTMRWRQKLPRRFGGGINPPIVRESLIK